MERNTFLAAIFTEIFLVVVGVVCLIWPQKVQGFALSYHGFFFYNPFKAWTATRYYLWSLRVGGLIALMCSAMIAISILKSTVIK